MRTGSGKHNNRCVQEFNQKLSLAYVTAFFKRATEVCGQAGPSTQAAAAAVPVQQQPLAPLEHERDHSANVPDVATSDAISQEAATEVAPSPSQHELPNPPLWEPPEDDTVRDVGEDADVEIVEATGGAYIGAYGSSDACAQPETATKEKKPRAAVKLAVQESWRLKFPWFRRVRGKPDGLNKGGEHAVAACMTCREHHEAVNPRVPFGNATNEYVQGTAVVYDASDLTKHATKSKQHQAAVKWQTERARGIEYHAKVAAERKRSSVLLLAPLLLLAALFVIQEGLAQRKWPRMLALLLATGNTVLNHKYTAKRYFQRCLLSLSEMLLCAQLKAIRASPYFALMVDSSTDITGEDHILIYVRYIDIDKVAVITQYLCCVKVADKTAEAICHLLLKVLEVLSLPVSKLVAFSSDGDSRIALHW